MQNLGNFLSEYRVILPSESLDNHAETINSLAKICHNANKRWWKEDPLQNNKGEKLMLIVSEIAEVLEGERKDLMDDHLPHRKASEVELADTLVRLLDYAGAYGYDLGGAFVVMQGRMLSGSLLLWSLASFSWSLASF